MPPTVKETPKESQGEIKKVPNKYFELESALGKTFKEVKGDQDLLWVPEFNLGDNPDLIALRPGATVGFFEDSPEEEVLSISTSDIGNVSLLVKGGSGNIVLEPGDYREIVSKEGVSYFIVATRKGAVMMRKKKENCLWKDNVLEEVKVEGIEEGLSKLGNERAILNMAHPQYNGRFPLR